MTESWKGREESPSETALEQGDTLAVVACRVAGATFRSSPKERRNRDMDARVVWCGVERGGTPKVYIGKLRFTNFAVSDGFYQMVFIRSRVSRGWPTTTPRISVQRRFK